MTTLKDMMLIEVHAKEFAEFIRKNNWSAIPKSDTMWFNIMSGEKFKTTDDLYQMFINDKFESKEN